MTLWIVAAIAAAVMASGIAFLALSRDEDDRGADQFTRPRHSRPWAERPEEPEGTTMADVPPPSGVPMHATVSEELSVLLESQELSLDEDEEPTGPVPKIVVTAAGGTHAGLARKHNEDSFVVLAEHELYAIADGMGGYAAGEVASRITVDTLARLVSAGDFGEVDERLPRRGAELASAIREANTLVRARAARDSTLAGMGTTIVCARFSPGRSRVYIAAVGDSRCYRIRDGEIRQLTTDHTLAAMGIKGPAGGKLSRAVGVFDDVDVDVCVDEPRPGDFYVLCSDGLYRMVADSVILRIVDGGESLESSIDDLIGAANGSGGRDNVTVVLVRIDEPNFDPGESGEHRLPG